MQTHLVMCMAILLGRHTHSHTVRGSGKCPYHATTFFICYKYENSIYETVEEEEHTN